MTITEIKVREVEYRKWLAEYFLRKDERYRKFAESNVAKNNKPLRSAGGKNEAGRGSWLWRWGDAIWCGDDHYEALAEFLEVDSVEMLENDEDDLISVFAENTYNEVIEQTLPQVYWTHIAGEIGRKPSTPEQERWMNREG